MDNKSVMYRGFDNDLVGAVKYTKSSHYLNPDGVYRITPPVRQPKVYSPMEPIAQINIKHKEPTFKYDRENDIYNTHTFSLFNTPYGGTFKNENFIYDRPIKYARSGNQFVRSYGGFFDINGVINQPPILLPQNTNQKQYFYENEKDMNFS